MKNSLKFHLKNSTKILLISTILLFVFVKTPGTQKAIFAKQQKFCRAEEQIEQTQQYAKAKADCFLFATSNTINKQLNNILFTVPEGYFVRLIETENERAYKVAYSNRIGYVLPESVKRVSLIPENAYLAPQSITTKQGGGTQLRSLPTTNSNPVALIPSESNITYLATTTGEKPADGSSSNWYFVQYFPESEPTTYYEGYVYSERVQTQIIIPENSEDDPLPPLPLQAETEQNESSKQSAKANPILRGMLIAVLCLPCIIFGLYLVVQIVSKRKLSDAL